MPTAADLTKYWDACCGVIPLNHLLRETHADRWVRFHALPQSKRYPETEREYGVVLRRHNEVLSHLFPAGRDLVLLTTGYSIAAEPSQDEAAAHPQAWHWRSVRSDPDDPDASWCHLYARTVRWRAGVFDDILRLVADDRINNVMIVGLNERAVYHPYDGGADVILADECQREALRERYRDWLSARPDGL